MAIETKTHGDIRVVKITGKLCMGPELDRFGSTMDELFGQGQNRVVLDLEDVPTIDSSAIGMMVRCLTAAKRTGGSIRLLKPTKFTVQTLKMVGLLNLFPSYDDLAQAAESFR
ncbi:MAG TPA: STAS domain-containing protein [Verrucomicrobiae bacterium]|nr:STAS domain-containing protein [Verrucomicrobiae bacterium]